MLFFSFFVQSAPALFWNLLGSANSQPNLLGVLTGGQQAGWGLIPKLQQRKVTDYYIGMGFAKFIGHQLMKLAQAQFVLRSLAAATEQVFFKLLVEVLNEPYGHGQV